MNHFCLHLSDSDSESGLAKEATLLHATLRGNVTTELTSTTRTEARLTVVSCDFNSLTKSVTMIFIRSELAHAHSYSFFAHVHCYDVVGAFQME